MKMDLKTKKGIDEIVRRYQLQVKVNSFYPSGGDDELSRKAVLTYIHAINVINDVLGTNYAALELRTQYNLAEMLEIKEPLLKR